MTPAARITLDGRDITANLIPAPFGMPLSGGVGVALVASLAGGFLGSRCPLMSLNVTDHEALKSDAVTFTLDNRDYIPAPKKGSKFEVWLGYVETGLVFMGQYQVDTWTKSGRPLTLEVSAKAAGMTTEIKSPKSRSYHGKTVGEIVEQVAGKNKISSKIHPELKSVKIGHIDQSSESDLHFLTRLSKRIGGNFKLANATLIMNKAGSGELPGGGAAPVFYFPEVGLIEWSATGSERGSYGSASAAWQDSTKGERQTVVEGKKKPRFRDRKLYKTEDEAKLAAKSQLASLNRGRVSFNCSFPGKPEVFAGARATIEIGDPDVDGLFGIKSATHCLNGSGLRTSIECETTNEEGGDDEGEGGEGGGE